MLGIPLLGVQATLPQHIPHHLKDLLPRAKKAAESAVLHSNRSNFYGHPVHDVPGIQLKHIIAAHIIIACVVFVIAHVIIVNVVACVVNNVTHLLFVVLAVKDGGGGRSRGCGSRNTHLMSLFCVCGGCVLWLKSGQSNLG
jgi:hypothetical protein